MEEIKPGTKTSEFWFALVAALAGAILEVGLVAPDSNTAKIIGVIVIVLASIGYSYSRGIAKQGK